MSLEPESPIDIFDASISPRPFPSKLVSPQEIIRAGQKLPYQMLLTKPDWVRPVYKSYWHSTVSGGRWSYVPTRLKFAQHWLFAAPTAALSNLYDFLHDTGLFDEPFEIPEGKGISQKERLNQVLIVVMQASVESMMTSGNQAIIVARPQRNGLQIFTVSLLDMKLQNPKESVLFQLVTPDGDEMDNAIY